MRTHRLAVLGSTVAALAGLLAGCTGSGSSTSSPSGTATASLAPRDALFASLAALTQTTSQVDLKQGTGTGQIKIDPGAKRAGATMSQTIQGQLVKLDLVSVSAQVWLKLDIGTAVNSQFGIDPTKWMTVDVSKLTAKDALPLDLKGGSDVLDLPGLLAGVIQVQRVDATHFAGTVDLTKATGLSSLADEDLKKLGDKAKAVPFTAAVDGQGRLTNLKIDTSAADPTLTTELTVSGYGTPQVIDQPPAAQTVPAPASVYTLLNG